MRFPSLIIEKASYSFAHIIGGLVVFIKTECGVILDFDSTPFFTGCYHAESDFSASIK